jgi:hypothetical protein
VIYKHYIPGLGTYFRDIGDIGDDDGAAFARYGDARLDKAMQWLDETIARHPADKIESIQVFLLGFSRGATLARAFARRIQDRCHSDPARPGGHLWTSVKRPFSIGFLGLFDTVASVGIPASAGVELLVHRQEMGGTGAHAGAQAQQQRKRLGRTSLRSQGRSRPDPQPLGWSRGLGEESAGSARGGDAQCTSSR